MILASRLTGFLHRPLMVFCSFLLAFVFFLNGTGVVTVFAQGNNINGLLYPFYDPNSGCSEVVPDTHSVDPKQVYVLGDSITVAATSEIERLMSERGYIPTKINAVSGRNISIATPALDAVTEDASTIANSDTAVIALGTNSRYEDLTVEIPKLVSGIRSHNPSINIYWVNLFFETQSDYPRDTRNQQINDAANSLNFTVIDALSAGIELISDNVHTTAAGTTKFAETLVNGLTAAPSTPRTVSGDGCECSVGTSGSYSDLRQGITWGEGVWGDGSDKYASGLSGPYTIEQWAIHVLKNIARKAGIPENQMVTESKVVSLVAWSKAEGGGVDGNNGTFNPINTKSTYSDIPSGNQGNAATDSNSQGYTTFDDGVEAITRALFNGLQKRIASALLDPNLSQEAFIEAVAGNFEAIPHGSSDPNDVVNHLEHLYPGDGVFAALSITGFDYGGGIGDRALFISIKQDTLRSVRENYAAYAGKVLDGSPTGTPAPLVFNPTGGSTGPGLSIANCNTPPGAIDTSQATDVAADGFPIYKQFDPRWANEPYGAPRPGDPRTIESSGCGPAAMAMIITALTGEAVTPSDTAAFGMQEGTITWSSGGGSNGVALAELMAANWGLQATFIGANRTAIEDTINNGGYVVVSGRGGLPFSQGGHFVVIRAITSDGMWLVGDSSHGDIDPETKYDPETMISEFTAGGYSSYAITK